MEFVGFAEAPERSPADDGFAALGKGAVVVEKQFPVLFGEEETGHQGVDADTAAVFSGHVHGQPAGEVFHAGLGRRVADDAGDGGGCRVRGVVDDRSSSAVGHGGTEYERRKDGAMKIEVNDLPVGIEVEVVE